MSYHFTTAGPLNFENPFYITRTTDAAVEEALTKGEFCYIMGPRQVGKSSLMVRLKNRLGKHGQCGIVTVSLDINKSPENWYTAFSGFIAKEFEMYEIWTEWWKNSPLPVPERWFVFIEEHLLDTGQEHPIYIFIDEVDNLLNSDKTADDFFIGLRTFYTRRADLKHYNRLRIALFGCTSPWALVKSIERTNFNVLKNFKLTDFSKKQCRIFEPSLEPHFKRVDIAMGEIFKWTHGHPYMVQKVLQETVINAPSNKKISSSKTVNFIDTIVKKLFVNQGRFTDENLKESEDRCLKDSNWASAEKKLKTYQILLDDERIPLKDLDAVHTELYLDGLATIRQDTEDEDFLYLRNRIISTVFDEDWVDEEITKIYNPDISMIRSRRAQHVQEEDTLDEVKDELVRFFGIKFGKNKLYQFSATAKTTAIKNCLYRFPINRESDYEALMLEVFINIRKGISGRLWEQEVRALNQLAGYRHTALPRLFDAGFEKARRWAYVITDRIEDTLTEEGFKYFRKKKSEAFSQFYHLVDGLNLLHNHFMLHRNIHPGSINVYTQDKKPHLRFSRFEMSSLLRNSFRTMDPTKTENGREEVLQFFRNQDEENKICYPPERMARLYPDKDKPKEMIEDIKSDIFSLGIIAFQMFVGPISNKHIKRIVNDGNYSPENHRVFIDSLHREINTANVPEQLKKIIIQMTQFHRNNRTVASEILGKLAKYVEDILYFWNPELEDNRYLIAYDPIKAGEVISKSMALSFSDSRDSALKGDQLNAFLNQDLFEAKLVYSHHGFRAYAKHPHEEHENAKYVAVGTKLVYFFDYYHLPSHYGGKGPKFKHALMLRYSAQINEAWRLTQDKLLKKFPKVKIVPLRADDLVKGNPFGYPSWEEVLNPIEQDDTTQKHQKFMKSLELLLDMEQARLNCRIYAVKLIHRLQGISVVRIDDRRDRNWIADDALMSNYNRNELRRPPLGDMAERIFSEGYSHVHILPDRDGMPDMDPSFVVEAELVKDSFKRIDFSVRWRALDEKKETIAWMVPPGDFGLRSLLVRQKKAFDHLSEMPNLVEQLETPISYPRLNEIDCEFDMELKGNAEEVISTMTNSSPFFALHGPPGTGKTLAASFAIQNILLDNPEKHILVSAQSHYALDNLGERSLKQIENDHRLKDINAIRISSNEGQVSPTLQDYLSDPLTNRTIDRIREHCHAEIPKLEKKKTSLGDRQAAILRKWEKAVNRSSTEIKNRLQRGANLVLCTTGISSEEYLGSTSESGFDWVILEEAAKAWPTELLMPLTHSYRWALIGDHRQLRPFGYLDIENWLDEMSGSDGSILDERGLSKQKVKEVFYLFQTIFKRYEEYQEEKDLAKSKPGHDYSGSRQQDNVASSFMPIERLEKQFRFTETIGNLISKLFYDNGLSTGTEHEDRKYEIPGWMKGRDLIWVDTGSPLDAKDSPCWANSVEKDIIISIVRQLKKTMGGNELNRSVKLLSPYKAQLKQIDEAMKDIDELKEHTDISHTVDSFQGRESDIVIVSMVRCNSGTHLSSRIGFLQDEERINVLFSRARRNLIIVGSFSHFKETTDPRNNKFFWPLLCETINDTGIIMTREELSEYAT